MKKRFSFFASFMCMLLTGSSILAAEYNKQIIHSSPYMVYVEDLSNGTVAWAGQASEDDSTSEIFYFDGQDTVQITDNNFSDTSPIISDGKLFWFGYPGNNYEIFHFDGQQVVQLTNDGNYKHDMSVDNGQVVWAANDAPGGDMEIFFFDGTQTIQLSDNDTMDDSPQISDGQIVWRHYTGSEYEIVFFDGTLTQRTTLAPQTSPASLTLDNGQIYWIARVDGVPQVFRMNGQQEEQLTFDDSSKIALKVDGDVLSWQVQTGPANWDLYRFESGVVEIIGRNTFVSGDFAMADEKMLFIDRELNNPRGIISVRLLQDDAVSTLSSNTDYKADPHVDNNKLVWTEEIDDTYYIILSTETAPVVTGDANSDGIVNIVDALMIAQYYNGSNPPGFNAVAADVDCNGRVDIVDALMVAQYYSGLILEFTCVNS